MKEQQAFPGCETHFDEDGVASYHTYVGMTMRQYYKSHISDLELNEMVPTSIAGCAELIGVEVSDYKPSRDYHKVLSIVAGRYADAMIAEDAARATKEGEGE